MLATVDHTADAHRVAAPEPCDCTAHGGDMTNDLMPGNAGIARAAPFGSNLVKIGVVHTAIGDGDLHIMFPGRAAFYVQRFQGLVCDAGAIGFHDHDRALPSGRIGLPEGTARIGGGATKSATAAR